MGFESRILISIIMNAKLLDASEFGKFVKPECAHIAPTIIWTSDWTEVSECHFLLIEQCFYQNIFVVLSILFAVEDELKIGSHWEYVGCHPLVVEVF